MPPVRRQSAARLPSLARYGVRAVDTGNETQGLVAKPRTPHPNPQSAQLFKIEDGDAAFLWGFKRGTSLSRKRSPPFFIRFPYKGGKVLYSACAATIASYSAWASSASNCSLVASVTFSSCSSMKFVKYASRTLSAAAALSSGRRSRM